MASSEDNKAMDDVREEADGEVTNNDKSDRVKLGYCGFKSPLFYDI